MKDQEEFGEDVLRGYVQREDLGSFWKMEMGAGESSSDPSTSFLQVYIIGHVPPGFFEKTQNKAWFRESFNEQYLKVIQKHHRVIAGQFFGHHHTDTFRMFYDDTGTPS